jgi:hypothetical protein
MFEFLACVDSVVFENADVLDATVTFEKNCSISASFAFHR